FARVFPGVTVTTRRGPQGDLPERLSGFDRLVISGSRTSALDDAPWIDRLHALLREAVGESKPTLAVCYGHQSLARAFGGKNCVRKAEVPEVGWTRIKTLRPSRLFEGLPDTFVTYSSHFDEVAELPSLFVRTASSEACVNQAFEVPGKPIFGIQFHPEKNVPEAERIFDEMKKTGRAEILLHPAKSKALYDPKVGEAIFENFFKA
ncbi:MAG: type 1 glutamine amidotransferase, partial [Bdellovibrionota bacterium]